MSYLNVISLQTAKDYLGVDDTARDTEITRMIKSSCMYVEKYTNMLFFSRDKTYYKNSGCLRVYDYPINTNDIDFVVKGTYSEFSGNEVTLNVGYESPTDVPTDLVEACLQMIEGWFYASETKNKTNMLPQDIRITLDIYKRFLL